MSTTTARFQNGKIYTIQDYAFVQHPHSGIMHVAGKVGENFAFAAHSNTGKSTVFSGVFVDENTFNEAVEEINGYARYHILNEIIQGAI